MEERIEIAKTNPRLLITGVKEFLNDRYYEQIISGKVDFLNKDYAEELKLYNNGKNNNKAYKDFINDIKKIYGNGRR